MERHWACGCPIGSKTCAYQNPPKEPKKDPQTTGFGWWWYLCGGK